MSKHFWGIFLVLSLVRGACGMDEALDETDSADSVYSAVRYEESTEPSRPAVPLRKMVQVRTVYEKKTTFGDQVFLEREDEDNGQVRRYWFMNGVAVDKKIYENSLEQIELALLRQDREREQQRRDNEREVRLQTVMHGYQKVLQLKVAQIEQWLQKINQHHLDSFLQFAPSTVTSQQDLEYLKQEMLPQAKNVAVTGTLGDLQMTCAQIDMIPHQLRDLFYSTAKHAITVCNDTRMLQDLLTVVEQA